MVTSSKITRQFRLLSHSGASGFTRLEFSALHLVESPRAEHWGNVQGFGVHDLGKTNDTRRLMLLKYEGKLDNIAWYLCPIGRIYRVRGTRRRIDLY